MIRMMPQEAIISELFGGNCGTRRINVILPSAPQEKTYEDGLNEAWAAAKRLLVELEDSELDEIFDNNWSIEMFLEASPQDIISKLDEWESKQKFNPNDQVYIKDNPARLGVVMGQRDSDVYIVMWSDGRKSLIYKSHLAKTGRTIDIAALLKQIGEPVPKEDN